MAKCISVNVGPWNGNTWAIICLNRISETKLPPAISRMTFSNAFSWTEVHEIRLRFQRSLFLSFELAICSIGSDNGLVANRRRAIIWNNGGFVPWCKYASLGLNVLMECIIYLVMVYFSTTGGDFSLLIYNGYYHVSAKGCTLCITLFVYTNVDILNWKNLASNSDYCR